MATYIIKEVQNLNSNREGVVAEAVDLDAAKKVASASQFYKGTVMVIENENGLVMSKKVGRKWIDSEF